MDKPSKYILERDKKDLEYYLENSEKDPALFPKEFIDYKKRQLDEVKRQLKEFYNS